VKIYPTFYEKSFEKETLKPKIKKRPLLPLFYCLCSVICRKKSQNVSPEMEFKEFEPRFKSAKTRFKFSADLNLETFDTILSGTNHI